MVLLRYHSALLSHGSSLTRVSSFPMFISLQGSSSMSTTGRVILRSLTSLWSFILYAFESLNAISKYSVASFLSTFAVSFMFFLPCLIIRKSGSQSSIQKGDIFLLEFPYCPEHSDNVVKGCLRHQGMACTADVSTVEPAE